MKRLERARDFYGSWEALADRLLLPAVEQAMDAYEPFCTMHVDLLAYLLSFVTLADVKSVLLTCKTWYRVVYEKRAVFWARLVNMHGHLDTFCTVPVFPGDPSVVETLQQQVEWLFKRGQWLIQGKTDSLYRYNGSGLWIQLSGRNGGCVTVFKCGFPYSDESSTLFHYCKNGTYADGLDKTTIARLFKPYADGATYTGSGIRDDKTTAFLPHGDGRWTFADGTVLEGEGVAWKGRPRWPSNKRARVE